MSHSDGEDPLRHLSPSARARPAAAARPCTADLMDGCRATAWLVAVVSCLIAFPVMGIAKLSMEPTERPFFPNNPSTSLPYTTSGTVPFAPVYLVIAPVSLVILLIELFAAPEPRLTRAQRLRTWLQVSLAMLVTCVVNAAVTEYSKVVFGSLRPDFQWRCTGVAHPAVLTGWNGTCTGSAKLVQDGRKSFPSGHTSMSAAVATFVALYLFWISMSRRVSYTGSGRLRDELWQLVGSIAYFPWMIAGWVAYTRVNDNRHHLRDVVAGYFLGVLTACFFFAHMVRVVQRAWDARPRGGRRTSELTSMSVTRTASGSVVTTVDTDVDHAGTRA